MLAFKTWLVNTLTGDATLQTLMNATASTMPIYPADVDVQPENFPAITYMDAGVAVMTRPQGVHVGRIQLDIWSTANALETETIYDRLQVLLNFKDSTTQTITGTLWWIREEAARDQHTPKRRLWHKSVDLKYWTSKSDGS